MDFKGWRRTLTGVVFLTLLSAGVGHASDEALEFALDDLQDQVDELSTQWEFLNGSQGGPIVRFKVFGTSDISCDDWYTKLDQATGNASGFTSVGSSNVAVANDGSWLFRAVAGDCSPSSNVPRAYALVPMAGNRILRNYWMVDTLP